MERLKQEKRQAGPLLGIAGDGGRPADGVVAYTDYPTHDEAEALARAAS
jgi:hypothetical protein